MYENVWLQKGALIVPAHCVQYNDWWPYEEHWWVHDYAQDDACHLPSIGSLHSLNMRLNGLALHSTFAGDLHLIPRGEYRTKYFKSIKTAFFIITQSDTQ